MRETKFHIALIDCGSEKFRHIVSIVNAWQQAQQLEKSTIQPVTTIKSLDQISACEAHHFQAAIISGGPFLFTQDDALIKRFCWLKDNHWYSKKLYLFGICLGFQAICQHYGAKVFRGPEIRDSSLIHFATKAQNKILGKVRTPCHLAEDHCEGVSLPENFTLLGHSKDYAVEMLQHKTLPIWGSQFHPEVDPNHNKEEDDGSGKQIIHNFLDLALEYFLASP